MIDRYLIRYFLAIVDRGTFSRAAEHVNVAQPTLSVGIAKLERLLGAPLFHRSSQRVHLTDAGAQFVAHARRIESEFNLAEAAVKGTAQCRTIRLGVLSTIPTAMLAEFIRNFHSRQGEDRVEIVEAGERDLLQRLTRGRLDVALTLIRNNGTAFAHERLYSERYSLAMPASHPLAMQDSIAAEALGGNTMIVRLQCEVLSETSKHFIERGIRPFFALRSNNDDRVLAMVGANLGITIMPDSYSAPGVVRPRLIDFYPERRIGLVYAPESQGLQHSGSWLISCLRAQFGNEQFQTDA